MMIKVTSLALAAVLVSGCSTLFSKSDYIVSVNSFPAGAKFSVTNRDGKKVHEGLTPASIPLTASAGYFKGETYLVDFAKEGFTSKSYILDSSVDGWYFGNLLLGGILGMLIIDPLTGAMFNLPDRIDVPLEGPVSKNDNNSIQVTTIDKLTPEQIARLEPIAH